MKIFIKNKKILLFLIFFLFWTNSIKANTPSEFINKITEEASTILSSSENEEIKISKLIEIGKESVDIKIS